METKFNTIIIGSGLTGLATAYFLNKKTDNFLVIEKNEVAGGSMQSYTENDFIFESGPNTGVVSNIETYNLLNELNDKLEIQYANDKSKKRYIFKNESWKALPSGLISGITSPLFSLKDKLRILGEPFRAKGKKEHESIAEMVQRRLGKSYLDYAVDPFISGVYAGDPNYLITKYALPKLYNLEQEYGSFIKGAFKKKKNTSEPKFKKRVFSTSGGFSSLIKSFVDSIGENKLKTGCNNISVNLKEGIYTVEYSQNNETHIITADNVVLTCNSTMYKPLLNFIENDFLHYCSSIKFAQVIQVAIGFKNWNDDKIDGFGGLIPRIENKELLGVLYPSTCFSNRAPETGALFAVFMGGFSKPEYINLTDEVIISKIAEFFKKYYKIKEFNPDLLRIFRHQKAIPQYGADSGKRFEEIKNIQKLYPGLILAGNSIDGIGIADRIKQAYNIAQNIEI